MDIIRIDYSTNNIHIPSEQEYMKKLIDMSDKLCRRMRWKAYFYLHPNASQSEENYGFKSRKVPPAITHLHSFKTSLQQLVASVQFKRSNSSFQSKLRADVKCITSTNHLVVPADKTTNYYKMTCTEYTDLLHKAVTERL